MVVIAVKAFISLITDKQLFVIAKSASKNQLVNLVGQGKPLKGSYKCFVKCLLMVNYSQAYQGL